MSKTKSTMKASKPTKPDVLTKVKDAAVAKPAQKSKSKSKEVAKQAVAKDDKKSKKSKKVKEPTPEPSESEEESDESASSDSSEDEVEAPKPAKPNGTKKPVAKAESSDDSESDSSEDDEPAANGVLGKAPVVTEADSDSESSDSDESDAEVEAKANPASNAAKAVSSDEDSDGSDAESSEDDKPVKKAAANAKSDSESEEDSEDSSEDESQVKAKPATTKRKAEDEAELVSKKTKTDTESTQSANLFIGNLSWNVDEAWLKETFEEHGEIARVQLITDRATGRSKGFGYVEFVNAADAAAAHAAKQGAELDNRPMNVDFSNPRPPKSEQQDNRRKSYGDQVSEPSDTLFLGNLSFDCGQETVTEAFSPHGTIMGIRLPTDRETGEPKGFGYVTFASVDEAKAALEAMQGAYISNRPVRLDYSQPRPQNGDSPARGRGGFGGRGRGGFGDRGGRGRGGFGGRGRGGFDRGGRGGGRGGSTNRGGFGDFSGKKVNFD